MQTGDRRAAPDDLARVAEEVEGFPASRQAREHLLAHLGVGDLAEAASAIERSVALTLAVLRIANRNSARGAVASVTGALEVAAPGTLVAAVESLPVYEPVEGTGQWYELPAHVEAHAASVRMVTNYLTQELAMPDHPELSAAAILHDIGKVVLTVRFGERAASLYTQAQLPEDLVQAERAELGIDHPRAGAWLLRAWGLPERIAHTVECHHDRDATGRPAVVRLADLLVHYSHGGPTDLDELRALSNSLGITRSTLSDLLYELPQPLTARRAMVPCPLSERELDVLRLLAEGKVYKQIAQDLDLSASTVRSHLHRAYNRIGATDRAQAVLIATQNGWL